MLEAARNVSHSGELESGAGALNNGLGLSTVPSVPTTRVPTERGEVCSGVIHRFYPVTHLTTLGPLAVDIRVVTGYAGQARQCRPRRCPCLTFRVQAHV